jgi:hypothetical protein
MRDEAGKGGGVKPLEHQAQIIRALMMEAANTSETSVNFYQTIRPCNILGDSHLQNSIVSEWK